ncbi:bacteriohemerythrin [Salidesulfovibrio onnuriiensis]|uniref:bacteriohemerythrin n=1 Tax=Salidesulfovibrio onnuriiensis TaxID=2583823 RepID=UPI0011C7EBDA|nr:bacteriohemerythrin [Salidesulfovibrio onnuriiensis]
MPRLEWNDSLSIGIYRVDSQHMRLIEVANDFLRTAGEGRDGEAIQTTLTRLREYTVNHFRDEEAYMREIHYPRLARHQEEHRNLVQRVKQFQRDLYEQRDITVEVMRDFLREWLVGHIINSDLKIAEWLRAEEESRARQEQETKSGGAE